MAEKPEIDEVTGTDTTGHEWDGIKELNTPLPKWWLWTFYGTVVWGLAYTVFYPAWPLVTEATAGILGSTNRGALNAALEEHRAAQSVYTDRIAALDIEEVASDADLVQFARSGGAAIFRTNCSQCHGAGAAGVQAAGYPNLLDDDWLWGGTLSDIQHTVAHGIRNQNDPDARFGEMPAFGEDWLSAEEIAEVAQYARALAGLAEPTEAGAELFEYECASCHGAEGKGEPSLGAPNLTDAIWLYGGSQEKVVETITYGRAGVMPNWQDRLTDHQIKQVSIYVHSLGGGQ